MSPHKYSTVEAVSDWIATTVEDTEYAARASLERLLGAGSYEDDGVASRWGRAAGYFAVHTSLESGLVLHIWWVPHVRASCERVR